MEPIEVVAQVLGPTGDVLVRIVEVTYAMPDGGFRNQRHESYRSAFETTVGLQEDSAFITARSKAG